MWRRTRARTPPAGHRRGAGRVGGVPERGGPAPLVPVGGPPALGAPLLLADLGWSVSPEDALTPQCGREPGVAGLRRHDREPRLRPCGELGQRRFNDRLTSTHFVLHYDPVSRQAARNMRGAQGVGSPRWDKGASWAALSSWSLLSSATPSSTPIEEKAPCALIFSVAAFQFLDSPALALRPALPYDHPPHVITDQRHIGPLGPPRLCRGPFEVRLPR